MEDKLNAIINIFGYRKILKINLKIMLGCFIETGNNKIRIGSTKQKFN